MVERSSVSVGYGEDAHRQFARAANLADAPTRVAGEFEAGEALHEFLDGHLQFEPGKVRADAAVDTEAERGMPVLLAVDDERVGVCEFQLVAVGGREGEQHPVVLLLSDLRPGSGVGARPQSVGQLLAALICLLLLAGCTAVRE